MTEKPILTLTSKDFQSGISVMGAHTEQGGIFLKAAGLTPLFDAGASQSVNNGLLMAGAAGTTVGGSLTGAIIASCPDNVVNYTGGLGAIFATDDNKLWKLALASGIPSGSISSLFTAGATLTGGLVTFQSSAGNTYAFYRQATQIGRYDGITNTDAWQSATTDYFGAMHVHYGLNKIIFGNGAGKIGTVANDLTVNLSALTFDKSSSVTSISDDGIYVIAALTRNSQADTSILSDTRIIFWDGSVTTGFIRDYPITDPFIYKIQKTPLGVFAFGLTGIWQVSLIGVKKIFNHSPGIYTAGGASVIHYGGATSFFSDALIWGGQVGVSTVRALKALGKLDSAAASAYLQPLALTPSVNITNINGQLSKGYVFVADSTPQLKYYPIGSGTPQTGVSGQTIYFPFAEPVDITHIDVIFGEPLASGDTLTLDTYKDEDTAAISFGAVSYDAAKTIRRYQFTNANGGKLEINQQLGLLLTFTAGSVKIKKIEVFGTPKERVNV